MSANQQNNPPKKPGNGVIGRPLNRVDGRLKVTGGARYAAEFPLENMAHAVLVSSTIANGRIRSFDTSAAKKVPGVLAIITHENAPKLQPVENTSPRGDANDPSETEAAKRRVPLQSPII